MDKFDVGTAELKANGRYQRQIPNSEGWCVNAWNEWDPLKEVLVGRSDGSAVPPLHPPELAKIFHLPNTVAHVGPRPAEKVAKANAELENFCTVLTNRGIIVTRPRIEPNVGYSTPYYSTATANGWNCPRDTLIVFGNEIMEAATCWRSRNFEVMAYRDLLMDYFRRDPNMLWTSAPFPALRDVLFREEYEKTADNRLETLKKMEYVTKDWVEPTFDAADMVRCGKDIFMLHSHTANLAGYHWVKHQLARRGLRTHLIHTPAIVNPSHIDASIVPLRPPTNDRPGVVLSAANCIENCEVFRTNGWEIIECPEPEPWIAADPNYHGKSGKMITMNILSLDPNTVVIEEQDKALAKLLESWEIECVGVPFRNVVEFGGGIHCATLDINRTGGCHSYFPSFDADE